MNSTFFLLLTGLVFATNTLTSKIKIPLTFQNTAQSPRDEENKIVINLNIKIDPPISGSENNTGGINCNRLNE